MANKSALLENYKKGDTNIKDVDPKKEFSNLLENVLIVRVKRGSKTKNLMAFVEKSFKDDNNKQLIFSGCGDAIEKTISYVEITKEKFKNLHQITRLNVLSVIEYWDPINPELDRLQVTKEVPMINILLSKEPLNSDELGYQSCVKKMKSSTSTEKSLGASSGTV